MKKHKVSCTDAGCYCGPGHYVAICNTTSFDGHYVKRFEVPVVAGDKVSASWYFLN